MEYSKQRIEWIDIARGILIILVVLGHNHINIVFNVIINSFHMVAFFMLSGFTLKASEQIETFIWKKCKRLLFPYFIFAFIMLAFQFLKTFIFSEAEFDLKSGLISIFIPIGGRDSTTTYWLWFFPCLFLAEIMSYIIIRAWKMIKATGIITFVGIIVLGEESYQLSGRSSIIAILPIAITFIILGYILKGNSTLIEKKRILLIFSLIMFIVFVLTNWMYCKFVLGIDVVDLSHMRLGYWPLFMLSGLFGSLVICELAIIVKKNKILSSLGRDTMYYYGLHYEVQGAVGKLISNVILRTIVIFMILYLVIRLYKKAKLFFRKMNMINI